ncbi:MAG: hypothetical protein V8R92_00660 [Eubacterium sp.]|uniref:Uncharacterized protein n=1 Tax=Eubacterium album TaxID=2978477 RepID=A0ABT2M2A9_9FIRM|nr:MULTISPECIES: hypothetical protein [unclassified Eubacterium (in: firmicutes)]MCT7399590.1 hypothetical protein [Eubacterium sp. LFL-14]MEE0294579.1 hypothetical protein [Eubacterium sp.]
MKRAITCSELTYELTTDLTTDKTDDIMPPNENTKGKYWFYKT